MSTRPSRSLSRFLKIEDRFYPEALSLRSHFDTRFEDPRQTNSNRFVWDYWYVPDQYCLHRTPAYHFFPRAQYASFHKALVQWGRENLGCYDVSPPWLSYYIDGSEQHLHSDVPHGPWAFVFSLTSWNTRQFEGGETLLLKPETLSYWEHVSEQSNRERSSFVERVPANFNRLTVFDPRFPHGVTRVSGVRDPRHGRIVIHGWFTKPEAYVVGELSRKQATPGLNEGIARLQDLIPTQQHWQGTCILRMKVSPSGKVTALSAPTNSVIIDRCAILNSKLARQSAQALQSAFKGIQFPKSKAATLVTLPLLFESKLT